VGTVFIGAIIPSMPLRLQVFQHVAHEGLGSLATVFAAQGATIAYTRLFTGERPPETSTYDVLVVLGGPMNVYEIDLYPWLSSETVAIRAALDAGKPVLGLCLGAQLMSVALGGVVTRNAHREIGWWPVAKIAEGADHPAVAGFPDRFLTFHWHGDTFSIPPGGTALFRSEGCAHQGFAWGPCAVGLQFHPEITAEAIATWIAEAKAEGGGDLKPGTYVQTAEDMVRDAVHVADNNRWMEALCRMLLGR
jgi:GMP synthase-like glutamine amidotransferase